MTIRLFPASIALPFFMLAGCANSLHTQIDATSQKVERSLETAFHIIQDAPVSLSTRRNPCQCDDALSFEVNLYGHWQFVYLIGTQSALAQLNAAADSHPDAPFEYTFSFTDSLYTASSGQQFYTLRVDD